MFNFFGMLSKSKLLTIFIDWGYFLLSWKVLALDEYEMCMCWLTFRLRIRINWINCILFLSSSLKNFLRERLLIHLQLSYSLIGDKILFVFCLIFVSSELNFIWANLDRRHSLIGDTSAAYGTFLRSVHTLDRHRLWIESLPIWMICDLQHTAALFVSYSNSLEMFQGTVVNLDQDIMSDGGAFSPLSIMISIRIPSKNKVLP